MGAGLPQAGEIGLPNRTLGEGWRSEIAGRRCRLFPLGETDAKRQVRVRECGSDESLEPRPNRGG